MNIRKLSINKACVFLGVFLLLAAGFISAAVYVLTRNTTAVWYVLLFSLFVLLCVICFVALIRRKLAHFSDAFCAMLDDMLSGRPQRKKACFIKSTSVLADCMRSCRKIKTVSQKSRAICRN